MYHYPKDGRNTGVVTSAVPSDSSKLNPAHDVNLVFERGLNLRLRLRLRSEQRSMMHVSDLREVAVEIFLRYNSVFMPLLFSVLVVLFVALSAAHAHDPGLS